MAHGSGFGYNGLGNRPVLWSLISALTVLVLGVFSSLSLFIIFAL